MLELGQASESLHRELGAYALDHGVDLLVSVAGAARSMGGRFFEDPVEAGEFVRNVARPGDAILFKGSRGTHVERALERFLG
jgi:UDP-N-acetylmuramoyl-tripeptide--D-alanyl-D-alanine ligase